VTVTLEIPDEIARSLGQPAGQTEKELRKELALALYSRGVLSAGKAAEWAQLSRGEFERLIARRAIIRPLAEDEVQQDLKWASEE